MRIIKAERKNLKEILDLQYLAYQSEAMLYNDFSIQPLKQTLEEMEQEFETGIFLKAVDDNDIIIGSVRAYAKNGTAFINKLMVHPNFQEQGIGTKLLIEIEKMYPQNGMTYLPEVLVSKTFGCMSGLGMLNIKNSK